MSRTALGGLVMKFASCQTGGPGGGQREGRESLPIPLGCTTPCGIGWPRHAKGQNLWIDGANPAAKEGRTGSEQRKEFRATEIPNVWETGLVMDGPDHRDTNKVIRDRHRDRRRVARGVGIKSIPQDDGALRIEMDEGLGPGHDLASLGGGAVGVG